MVYSDNSRELKKAVKMFGFSHRRSTPGVPATNTLAEGTVQKITGGTGTISENAGLPACYWPFAARHWCFAHCIEVKDGDSIYNKQLERGNFPGHVIPFGALVDFLPSPLSKEKSGKNEPDTRPGVFFGYHLDPGGRWSGQYYVVSLTAFIGISLRRNTRGKDAKVHVQRVRELVWRSGQVPEFPLKARYDYLNRTIEGLIEDHEEKEKQEQIKVMHELPPDAPADADVELGGADKGADTEKGATAKGDPTSDEQCGAGNNLDIDDDEFEFEDADNHGDGHIGGG